MGLSASRSSLSSARRNRKNSEAAEEKSLSQPNVSQPEGKGHAFCFDCCRFLGQIQLLAWAERSSEPGDLPEIIHRDSHGSVLAAGDTVTLIKDLVVKGGGFTAKRGTSVRGIALVPYNETQIEGRVNGQRIVILTEFTKKSA